MLYIILFLAFLAGSIFCVYKAFDESSDGWGLFSIIPIIITIIFCILGVTWIFSATYSEKVNYLQKAYERELTMAEIKKTSSDNLEYIVIMKKKIRSWNEYVRTKQIQYNESSWFLRYFIDYKIKDWNNLEMIPLDLIPVETPPSKKIIVEK